MENYLDLDVRKMIYDCVSKSPGLHFREIQRRTSLATGSLDYHLHFLHKNGMVRTEKAGGFIRYYVTNIAYDQRDKELLHLLRHNKVRHILIFLIQKKKANATDIARAANLSSSNLSWYLKSLGEKNIIVHRKKGRFRFYSVVDKEKIIKCLVTYKESFFDSLVDGFIEAWELDQ
jgi:predicted transcriptional regulator